MVNVIIVINVIVVVNVIFVIINVIDINVVIINVVIVIIVVVIDQSLGEWYNLILLGILPGTSRTAVVLLGTGPWENP